VGKNRILLTPFGCNWEVFWKALSCRIIFSTNLQVMPDNQRKILIENSGKWKGGEKSQKGTWEYRWWKVYEAEYRTSSAG